MADGYSKAIGYFFGRVMPPDELTIAFIGENEDLVIGLASILQDIGPGNLQVVFKMLATGFVEMTVLDRRDPENFSDTRSMPMEYAARFLYDLEEDHKFIITVGDRDLNFKYDVLRLELEQVDWIPEYLN